MITSSLDLTTTIAAFILLPLIIWVNYSNRRGPLTGYVWRESPNLARVGLAFLALTWVGAGQELATYYGVFPTGASEAVSLAVGIPMFILLSVASLAMGTALFIKHLRSRGSP